MSKTIDFSVYRQSIFSKLQGLWMKGGYLVFVVSILTIALGMIGMPKAVAQAIPYINVRDYGAIPNDQNDDTLAIQAALDAAFRVYWVEQLPGGGTTSSFRTVFFPSGKYIISNTLNLAHTNLLGEGTSILQQTNSTKDIIWHDWLFRITIENMSFVGGQNHIYFDTHNTTARVTIKNCQFFQAGSAAVRMALGSNSTVTTINHCLFVNCNQAVISYGDKTKLNDCEIGSSLNMLNKAVIENRGASLVIEGGVFTPDVNPNNDQRWIDNVAQGVYSAVLCKNVRFGGEGAGMTIVVNWSPYVYTYPVTPSSVILDSCELYAAGNPLRRCAVYCEQIPNQIIIRNCMGLPGTPPVLVKSSIDLNTYLDNAAGRPDGMRFLCDKATVEVIIPSTWDWPEQMKPYQADEIEATAAPTTGHWKKGTFIRNRNWSPGQPFGWQCSVAGEPGTWVARYMN